MSKTLSICPSCRLRLLSRLQNSFSQTQRFFGTNVNRTPNSCQPIHAKRPINTFLIHHEVRRAASNQSTAQEAGTSPVQDSEEAILPPGEPQEDSHDQSIDQYDRASYDAREQLGPEEVARHARKVFGDRLPEGILREEEYKTYERLFDTPLQWEDESIDAERVEEAEQDDVALFKEGKDGSLQELDGSGEALSDGSGVAKTRDKGLTFGEATAMMDFRTALINQGGRELDAFEEKREEFAEEYEEPNLEHDSESLRAHPFTLASRASFGKSSVQLPAEMVNMSSDIIANISIKHLTETAERTFGGQGLPYGAGTPLVSRTMPQKPIPLTAAQGKMLPIEADAFVAALMPGFYASLYSVLVESRRRLGTAWIEQLLKKEGGPKVLDVGAGGAGVLAWREIIKAEWSRMHPEENTSQGSAAPLGKATVLTGSDVLRHRSSRLLENTTFLPRLPDYVHVRDDPDAQRKRFDIVIASHSLWPLNEDYLRRQHILNLWRLLNPDGGVLILLEKGIPRGFETVAEARKYLLQELFPSTSNDPTTAATLQDPEEEPNMATSSGAIIAPCTTHKSCPLYKVEGVSRQRKDYCRFTQRFMRPAYLQRLLGATNRNYDDVSFSYVVAQRGVAPDQARLRSLISPRAVDTLQGKELTDRAFAGYDIHDSDLQTPNASTMTASVTTSDPDKSSSALTTPQPSTAIGPSPMNLPRILQPPIKNKGHAIIDLCTPAGTFERWTVPRSFGSQAYRDARKARWGDLWPLGAKTRVYRHVRTGRGGKRTKETEEVDEDEEDDEELEAARGRKDRKTSEDDRSDRGRPGKVARMKEKEKKRTQKKRERLAVKNVRMNRPVN